MSILAHGGVRGAWLLAGSGAMTGAVDLPGHGAEEGRRWDVALSFSGAQREYVKQAAGALKAQGALLLRRR